MRNLIKIGIICLSLLGCGSPPPNDPTTQPKVETNQPIKSVRTDLPDTWFAVEGATYSFGLPPDFVAVPSTITPTIKSFVSSDRKMNINVSAIPSLSDLKDWLKFIEIPLLQTTSIIVDVVYNSKLDIYAIAYFSPASETKAINFYQKKTQMITVLQCSGKKEFNPGLCIEIARTLQTK